MQKEIFEQPESVVNTMRGRVNFENNTGRKRFIIIYIIIIIIIENLMHKLNALSVLNILKMCRTVSIKM